MANDYKDMKRWLTLSEQILSDTDEQLNEDQLDEADSPRERLEVDLGDHESKIMQLKMEHLNLLIKKKYYEKDENIPEEKMFQFTFQDKGNYYQFTMPLVVLFNKGTRKYCAQYWDAFFREAGIDTTFEDNIAEALKQTTTLHLTMKLNKKMTKEVGGETMVKEDMDDEEDDDMLSHRNIGDEEWSGEKGNSVYKRWHGNGQIAAKMGYKHGKLDGECMEWHENGKLATHCIYKNGEIVKDFLEPESNRRARKSYDDEPFQYQ